MLHTARITTHSVCIFCRAVLILIMCTPSCYGWHTDGAANAMDVCDTTEAERIRIFLVGDVMLGRGIDRILPYSNDPILFERIPIMTADTYVQLAEMANGKIPPYEERGVNYTWGYTLNVLESMKPDIRIINLETAVTTSPDRWPGKPIQYRMHPKNTEVVQAAKIDCCVLANNHVLDWGYAGLLETLDTLSGAGIASAGAGRSLAEAQRPAVFSIPGKARVLVFSVGHQSSGIYPEWAATDTQPGLLLLPLHNTDVAAVQVRGLVDKYRKDGDVVILSIHWGGNWDWEVHDFQREFAHTVIDDAHVDVIHGHSSHHVKGVEIYRNKPIFYGCGDFLNDYEGIRSRAQFRKDLALMYFIDFDTGCGKVSGIHMVPTRTKHLRVNKAEEADRQWLLHTMQRESGKLGTSVRLKNEQFHIDLSNIHENV